MTALQYVVRPGFTLKYSHFKAVQTTVICIIQSSANLTHFSQRHLEVSWHAEHQISADWAPSSALLTLSLQNVQLFHPQEHFEVPWIYSLWNWLSTCIFRNRCRQRCDLNDLINLWEVASWDVQYLWPVTVSTSGQYHSHIKIQWNIKVFTSLVFIHRTSKLLYCLNGAAKVSWQVYGSYPLSCWLPFF